MVQRTIVKTDRFRPSNKTCRNCGEVKAKLSLIERTYSCESCGVSVDRDVNAAINLARLGETSKPQTLLMNRGLPGHARWQGVEACVRPQLARGNPRWLSQWSQKRQPCQPFRRLARRYVGTTGNVGSSLASPSTIAHRVCR